MSTTIHERPVELLQNLIRFDTTNPPGNEEACIRYLAGVLREYGIESTLIERAQGRPNLIARIAGTGNAAPLLLYGHVDVVTTAGQDWTHPPFGAEIHDGFLWGRGTLDMKGGVAMMVAAFLRAKAEAISLPGDVILCVVSDEEAGGEVGAKFLTEEHAALFSGVKHAIGEFGGFTMVMGGKSFYPIMVAEKQICWMRGKIRGQAGHGSMPIRGGTMATLAEVLTILDRKRLPFHLTPVVKQMFETVIARLGIRARMVLAQLLNPATNELALNLLGEQGLTLNPLFRNTVSPTILHASDKVNVIPGEIVLDLDGRLLPGQTPDDMLRELRALLGNRIEFEVVKHDQGPATSDLSMFDTLAGVLRSMDSSADAIPLLLSGVTDGRFFAKIGIQTYGFLPMQLPADFNFARTIHAANERIPVAAVSFGTEAIFRALSSERS